MELKTQLYRRVNKKELKRYSCLKLKKLSPFGVFLGGYYSNILLMFKFKSIYHSECVLITFNASQII